MKIRFLLRHPRARLAAPERLAVHMAAATPDRSLAGWIAAVRPLDRPLRRHGILWLLAGCAGALLVGVLR